MLIIKHYEAYDPKEFKSPWVGRIEIETGDLIYDAGGYTGDYKTGSAGDLYINDPVDGCFYAYGQKENKKKGSSNTQYLCYAAGKLIPVDSTIVRMAIDNGSTLEEAIEDALTATRQRIQQLHKKIDEYTSLLKDINNKDEGGEDAD